MYHYYNAAGNEVILKDGKQFEKTGEAEVAVEPPMDLKMLELKCVMQSLQTVAA